MSATVRSDSCNAGWACITYASVHAPADVDSLYVFLRELGATIVHPPEAGQWAPGYCSVLFEDPDGIGLEMNYVPGKGLLADGVSTDALGYR